MFVADKRWERLVHKPVIRFEDNPHTVPVKLHETAVILPYSVKCFWNGVMRNSFTAEGEK